MEKEKEKQSTKFGLCNSVDCMNPLENALKLLLRTEHHVHESQNNDTFHKMPVCIICDRFIKGCEEVHFVKKDTIKKKKYLTREFFEGWFQLKLPDCLREQYQIEDKPELEEFLLSPRSTRKNGDRYSCCSTCADNLRHDTDKPPQCGITNGFVIGHVPEDVVDDIDDVLAASIARIRFFS